MQSMKKIRRVQPIIKMKKTKVDNEASILAQINKAKVEAVGAMRESQKKYMVGIDELNKIRISSKRDNLDSMEAGLDLVKAQWYKYYRQVQELENKERAQIARLNEAERELKAIERLREKYETDFKKESSKFEQKMLDEMALRRFQTSAKP